MTVSTSRAAYEDCFHLLDRAMDSPAGIRHSCPTSGAAHHLRVRLNYARVLSRNEHSALLADDPKLGTSPYDGLILRVVADDPRWWVYIEPRKLPGETEELAPIESYENIHDLSPINNYSENGVRRRRIP
jgi:hypothetical protein